VHTEYDAEKLIGTMIACSEFPQIPQVIVADGPKIPNFLDIKQ